MNRPGRMGRILLSDLLRRFRNLSIKVRLGAAFTLLIIVTAVQGGLAISLASRIHQATINIEKKWLPSVRELANLRYLGVRHRAIASRHLMLDTDAEKDEVEERLRVIASEFKRTRDQYRSQIENGEEMALLR